MVQSRRASQIHAGLLCAWIAACLVPAPSQAVSFGGDLALTTNYIYRGFTETDDKAAVQLDLHASLQSGTFAGIFVSTLDSGRYRPYARYDLEEYIGQRFDLSSAWNTSLTATNYSYLGGNQPYSSNYQQISASVSYLDRWTFAISAIPDAVRFLEYGLTSRYPAYDAETSAQWLIVKGLYVTGGVGYYLFTGTGSAPFPIPTKGYVYGNAGLAYEWRDWRLDVGYYLTQERAQGLFPYATANHRFAGTLSWRF